MTPGETAFSVDGSNVVFGPGCLAEAGDHAAALGLERVALITEASLARFGYPATVQASLEASGIEVVVYDQVHVEPTDVSLAEATRFAVDAHVDGFVSVGGGSVIDTAKAASLYSTHPADLLTYVNAPVGAAQPVPGPLKPHIACPTTSGTGSECTGIAVFDLLAMKAKTGIVSRRLRPTLALVDPTTTATLPPMVVASTALDVLTHALESYTARPFTTRAAPATPSARPQSQGANPWSDLGCRAALTILGEYLLRAVADAADTEARSQVMWAATLAGIAFGNSGVHIPHAMSYAVAGLVRDYRAPDYPQEEPMVPHGISVIVNAPAAFRRTVGGAPERHLEAAGWLGADVRNLGPEHADEVLEARLIELMKAAGLPNGLHALGYREADVDALVARAFPQQRLLSNAPLEVDEALLGELFRDAMRYW